MAGINYCNPNPRVRSGGRPIQVEEITRLLGALGKTGSNLNQIARSFHLGDMSRARIEEALREAEAVKAELRKFLGRRG